VYFNSKRGKGETPRGYKQVAQGKSEVEVKIKMQEGGRTARGRKQEEFQPLAFQIDRFHRQWSRRSSNCLHFKNLHYKHCGNAHSKLPIDPLMLNPKT
jgi:hypothetical protein